MLQEGFRKIIEVEILSRIAALKAPVLTTRCHPLALSFAGLFHVERLGMVQGRGLGLGIERGEFVMHHIASRS